MGMDPTRRSEGTKSTTSAQPSITKEKTKINKIRSERITQGKAPAVKFKATQTKSDEPFSPAASVFYRPRMVDLAKKTPTPRPGKVEAKSHKYSQQLPPGEKQINDKLAGPLKRALPKAA